MFNDMPLPPAPRMSGSGPMRSNVRGMMSNGVGPRGGGPANSMMGQIPRGGASRGMMPGARNVAAGDDSTRVRTPEPSNSTPSSTLTPTSTSTPTPTPIPTPKPQSVPSTTSPPSTLPSAPGTPTKRKLPEDVPAGTRDAKRAQPEDGKPDTTVAAAVTATPPRSRAVNGSQQLRQPALIALENAGRAKSEPAPARAPPAASVGATPSTPPPLGGVGKSAKVMVGNLDSSVSRQDLVAMGGEVPGGVKVWECVCLRWFGEWYAAWSVFLVSVVT
ncbi:hypothetical protein BC936DRAFT_136536 [Jimgerdemannia flammicorona]|nr:hypothetical protein BC936DRAFT_136536 [Jimgerdemannia flammicorona]